MKRVHTLSLAGLIMSGLLLGGTAQAAPLPAHVEKNLIAICKAIKSNKPIAVSSAVKESRISYRALHKGLVCNGQDMLSFAATNNASLSSDFVARRVNRDPRVLTAKR